MIRVRLFAGLKDRAGKDELSVPPGPKTVSELLREITKEYPSLTDAIKYGRLLVSVNMEFAEQQTPIKDGDEIGLMPPFSGGEA